MDTHTVVLTAQIPVRPGSEPALAEAFDRLRERSLLELGVLSFERLTAPGGSVVLREEYRDEAALDAHLAKPHTGEFLAVLPELLASAATVRVDRARTIRAFDVPHTVAD
ncbi:antibiotic biosynthesis monooxygenase [Kitasatospora sp. NPDC047058]|uniref:putative quinol monooxygenase n=1 Tax=Kitasatospora sp. NPDC047058 TaxID=3155620 RepID=UPI0033F1F032